MSKTEHAKEPYGPDIVRTDRPPAAMKMREGQWVLSVAVDGQFEYMSEAEAKAAVACVNACAGINPEGVPLQYAALLEAQIILNKVARALLGTGQQLDPEELAKAVVQVDVAIAKAAEVSP